MQPLEQAREFIFKSFINLDVPQTNGQFSHEYSQLPKELIDDDPNHGFSVLKFTSNGNAYSVCSYEYRAHGGNFPMMDIWNTTQGRQITVSCVDGDSDMVSVTFSPDNSRTVAPLEGPFPLLTCEDYQLGEFLKLSQVPETIDFENTYAAFANQALTGIGPMPQLLEVLAN